VASETSLDPISPVSALGAETRPLFAYDASKEDRVVIRLYGFEGDHQDVRVAAEVYPVTRESSVPQWLLFTFPTGDHARRFVEEALVSLEYLDCVVADVDLGNDEGRARIANAAEQLAADPAARPPHAGDRDRGPARSDRRRERLRSVPSSP
jgi:hypothetical protein